MPVLLLVTHSSGLTLAGATSPLWVLPGSFHRPFHPASRAHKTRILNRHREVRLYAPLKAQPDCPQVGCPQSAEGLIQQPNSAVVKPAKGCFKAKALNGPLSKKAGFGGICGRLLHPPQRMLCNPYNTRKGPRPRRRLCRPAQSHLESTQFAGLIQRSHPQQARQLCAAAPFPAVSSSKTQPTAKIENITLAAQDSKEPTGH